LVQVRQSVILIPLGNRNKLNILVIYRSSRVDARTWKQSGGNITESIGTYGDQLELVHVQNMDESELNLIVGKCKNVRLHADISKNNSAVRILGQRLESVFCDGPKYGMIVSEYAWNTCSNLKKLILLNVNWADLRPVLATPKENIMLLHINITRIWDDGGDSSVQTIMNLIAQSTKSIEIFHFTDYISSARVLYKFIYKNKSTLRRFSVCNEGGYLNTQSDASKLVENLVECPLLEEISLNEVPEDSALQTLQKRGIYFSPFARIYRN